jgi:pathogenesis-related protein 1
MRKILLLYVVVVTSVMLTFLAAGIAKSKEEFMSNLCDTIQAYPFDYVDVVKSTIDQDVAAVRDMSSLDAHNYLRRRFWGDDSKALRWDSRLEADAHAWNLEQCKSSFHHSQMGHGENLAHGHATVGAAVGDWYNEAKALTRNTQQDGLYNIMGHFTQLQWAGTTKVGCDTHRCPGAAYGVYHTCEYSPAGNWDTGYAVNVPIDKVRALNYNI